MSHNKKLGAGIVEPLNSSRRDVLFPFPLLFSVL